MKKFKFKIYSKIIVIDIILTLLMTILVPILANYPPHYNELLLQPKFLKISFWGQYTLLTIICIFFQLFVCKFVFKNCFNYAKKFPAVSNEEVIKARFETYKVNKRLLISNIITLTITLFIIYSMIPLNSWLVMKLFFIFFSMFFSGWIMKSFLIKSDLNDIVKSTYEIYPNVTLPEKTEKFYFTLLKDTLPIFFVILILISLLGYSLIQKQIGDNNYFYYKQEMSKINISKNPKAQIIRKLDNIKLNQENDYYFLISENESYFSSSNGYVTDFFLEYAQKYLEENDGKVYEYFGIEEQAYCQNIHLENGTKALVGFKYVTRSDKSIMIISAASFIAFIIYFIIMLIWAKNIGKSISEVATNLSEIAKAKNLDFNIFLPVYSNDEIGLLSKSYNEIQEKTRRDIEEINNSKDRLIEKERLATLGQMIGGIAHNMKTPIMSIAGATNGLEDLITEYRKSIEDSEVTIKDHLEIAQDMETWVKKIKSYNSYMSDIITTVKGQAINMNDQSDSQTFTLKDLLTRVQILMRHELKLNQIDFHVNNKESEMTKITGNINSLVQVVNNLISNAIQSYPIISANSLDTIKESDNYTRPVYLNIEKKNDNIIISVKDKGCGIPEEVQKKLFKEMTTTKGHSGSGLGLFMSYSTIKGHFRGNLSFESSEGNGTTFYIKLPQD